MHEYAITESLISIVLSEAKKAGAIRVKAINIVIGELSSIVPECIELYFSLLSEGSILEGAKLNFINVPAEIECKFCNLVFIKRENGVKCPVCGRIGSFTEKGKEFYIESIEI